MKNKILFMVCIFLLFVGCTDFGLPLPQNPDNSDQSGEQESGTKKELIGLSITSLPCTFYNTFYNNVFSDEGLEVVKIYSDGTQEVCQRSEFYMVINGTIEINDGDSLDNNLLGQQEIIIYLHDVSYLYASFCIDIVCQEEENPPEDNPDEGNTIYGISVKKLPEKVVYAKGDYFSSKGLVCHAIDISFQEYEVEPTKITIVYEGDESWTENDISLPLPIGTHFVYVYYQEFSYYFNINVFDVQEIKDFAYENTGESITIGGYEGTDFTDTEEGVYEPIPGYDPNAPYEKVYSTPADFEYEFIEGSTTEINITGIKDEVESIITELTIPATIDGYTVKTVTIGILDYATEVRTFVMEEGIQRFSIDTDNKYASSLGCSQSKVTKVYLPSSLSRTEEDYNNYFASIALHYLQELSIDFTNFDKSHYYEVVQKDFLFCSNLKKITIRVSPNGYGLGIENGEWFFGGTSIEEIEYVFNDESAFDTLSLGCSWEAGSFENVKTLKKVTFPENCNIYIGEGAFANSSIETFVFPKNSKVAILPEAFKNCKNLATVIFEEGCVLYNHSLPSESFNGNETYSYNINGSHFEGSLWSQTVTKLDLSMWDECWLDFSNFTALQEVVVGSSDVRCNFAGCKNLTTITMNDDAVFLPYSLAETALTSVVIQGENYNDKIYDSKYVVENGEHPGLLTNCKNLTELTIKNCTVPPYLFGLNGTDNSNITFNYDNICLGVYAFYKCAFIKEFDMIKVISYFTVEETGHHFAYCENLEKVTVWSKICDYEGRDCDGYSYGLCYGMFYNCTNLKTVISDYPIFEFPKECFYNCVNLENINLPETTNSYIVGYSAFYGPTIKKLAYEEDSFYGVEKVAQKVVDNELVIYNFPLAFKNVPDRLVDWELSDVSIVDFSEIAVKNLTITKDFYYIPENFALGNNRIKTVTLDGDIEYAAFKDCTLLNTVILGDTTFHVVRENSFEGCTALEKIIVPTEYYDQYITAECWAPYRDLITVAE